MLTIEEMEDILQSIGFTFQDDTVRFYFDKLSKSDILLKSFAEWSGDVQKRTFRLLANDISADDTAAYMLLCMRIRDKYKDPVWIEGDRLEIIGAVRNRIPLASVEFVDELEKFDDWVRRQSNTGHRLTSLTSVGRIYYIMPWLLLLLHPSDRVIEVMRRLRTEALTTDIQTTVALVDEWEELKKYPIDWALNLVREGIKR